ncbi:serine hydrolase domain-containing protein [Lactobacillus corticis]|uniref:Serine hydrolase n=1 Tax=Lactobacillus corticis TaxID=2201249 RepID=A0A916QFR2_9LACO|nr:serine hydrolase domain-containing protein [Lactobacillus corticis]GFZ26479.1 serine hydrolase [Lactobacillus corticis]
MRQQLRAFKLANSAVVVKNGRTVISMHRQNSADTMYLINSTQKSMTAAMILKAANAGKLSLSDKLSKYYPQITGSDQVTIKNLLNMTYGLDYRVGYRGIKHYVSDEATLQQAAENTAFDAAKLGKWHYTSLNFVLLSGILSQTLGKSYEQLYQEEFIKPLGLKHTIFAWDKQRQLYPWVPGHINGKVYPFNKTLLATHNDLGAGSLLMSTPDLAKVMYYILAGKLLTAKDHQYIQTSSLKNGYNCGYYHRRGIAAANGAGDGYYTFFRSTNDGRTMLLLQTNQTKGNFKQIKRFINNLMKSVTKM